MIIAVLGELEKRVVHYRQQVTGLRRKLGLEQLVTCAARVRVRDDRERHGNVLLNVNLINGLQCAQIAEADIIVSKNDVLLRSAC